MKILAYTSPARGHLFPIMPILLELHARGHEISVRTLAAEVGMLRDHGFAASAIDPAIEAIAFDDFLARTPVGGIQRVVRTQARRAAIEVPDIRRAIAEEHPDLLLVDTNTWGAAAAAEVWGGPWALFQPFPTPLPSADTPPFGPGFRPAAGPLGRLRDRMLRPVVIGGYERVLLPPLNDVRRAAGAPPIESAADLYTRPPLTLYLTSRLFEYSRAAWPDSFCFTGPLLWDPPAEPPAWLGDVHDVVLVTTSSEFQDDGALVGTALAALADEACDVVATMPAGRAAAALPANAHVERFLPHSLVLPSAVVAITHGGMGATQKALAAGVPVVVVPWGRDQAEVGRRAEAAGVGVVLARRRLTPARMRDAVSRARRLKPAAEAFREALRGEGGARLAADRLEASVGARRQAA